MKNILLISLFFSLFLTTSYSQNDQRNQMEFDFNQLDQMMNGMMLELNQALGESHILMDQIHMEDLGNGKMQIDGDTVDVSRMFEMMTDNLQRFPKGMRPSEKHLDGLDETSKMLPDLLMQSADMFRNGGFEQIFGELFGEFDMQSPFDSQDYHKQESEEAIPDNKQHESESGEPLPTPPRGKKKETPKKLKHYKTVTI